MDFIAALTGVCISVDTKYSMAVKIQNRLKLIIRILVLCILCAPMIFLLPSRMSRVHSDEGVYPPNGTCCFNGGCGGDCDNDQVSVDCYYNCCSECTTNGCARCTSSEPAGCIYSSACAAGQVPLLCHPWTCEPVFYAGCPDGQAANDGCYITCGTCSDTGGGGGGGGGDVPPPPTTAINARSVAIPSKNATCADALASTTYLPDTLILIGTTIPAQTAASGAYATWLVAAGTYTISTVGPQGYVLKLACWQTDSPAAQGSALTATVTAGQTLTWNLGYTTLGPWLETGGGDVYGASTIKSFIPVGQYFSGNGAGGAPGLVAYGTSFDFDSTLASYGETKVSSRGWLLNETQVETDLYRLMYHRFGSPAPTATGDTVLDSQLAGASDPYYYDGNVTITGSAWNIPSGQSVTMFVSGNLTINTPVRITPGGFAAFIVKGDIIVDPAVGVAYSSQTV